MKVTPSDACKDNEDKTLRDKNKKSAFSYSDITINFFLFLS